MHQPNHCPKCSATIASDMAICLKCDPKQYELVRQTFSESEDIRRKKLNKKGV